MTSHDADSDDITRDDDHVRVEENTEEQLLKEKVSNMELENNLLRDEVKLLNTELAEAKMRVKEMQECELEWPCSCNTACNVRICSYK